MLKDDEYQSFLSKLHDVLPKGARYWLHRAQIGESDAWTVAIALVFAESEDDFHRYEQIYTHGVMAVQGDAAAAQRSEIGPGIGPTAGDARQDCPLSDIEAGFSGPAASHASDPLTDEFAEDDRFRDVGIRITGALPERLKLHLFGCLPQVGWLDSDVRRVRAYVLVENDDDFTLYRKVYERGVSEVERVPGVVDWFVREQRTRKASRNPPLGWLGERGTPPVKVIAVRAVGRGGLSFTSRLRLRIVAALLRRSLARGHSVIVTGDTASGKSVLLGHLPGLLVTPDRSARERELLPLSVACKGTGPLRLDDPQGFNQNSVRAVLEACAQGERPVAIAAQREEFIREVFSDYAAQRSAPPITWVKLEKNRRRARDGANPSPYEV